MVFHKTQKMKFKKNLVALLDTKAGEEHWHICQGRKEATHLSVPSPERHLFLLCSFEARLDEARLFGKLGAAETGLVVMFLSSTI